MLWLALVFSLHAEGWLLDDLAARSPGLHVFFRGTLKTDRGLWEFDDETRARVGPAPYSCGAWEEEEGGLHLTKPLWASVWFSRDVPTWRRVLETIKLGRPGRHVLQDEAGDYWSRSITVETSGITSRLIIDQSHTGNRSRSLLLATFNSGEMVRYEERTYPFDSDWEVTTRVAHNRDLLTKRRDADGRFYWTDYICELDVIN